MMNEGEKLMKGSVHEDNFFIVHDALVLMTAKEAIKWMIQKGCLHRWLLPLNGMQDRTSYAGFMPLDNSINRDILHSLRFHSVLSHFILDGGGTDEEERIMHFIY